MCASTNRWRLLLALGILAILAYSAKGATFPNVLFHMQDFTTQNVTNKDVEIFPYSTPFSTNSAVITNDRKRYKTDSTGSFTVTNMVPGCYQIKSSGSWTITPFNICFTTNAGNLNAHDLITSVVSVVDANANFVRQTSGVLVTPTNFFSANITAVTNTGIYLDLLNGGHVNLRLSNVVTHTGNGTLASPSNFFRQNLIQGSNFVLGFDSIGRAILNGTGSGGGGGSTSAPAYTASIDIWLSTRSDSDGDGSISNPRRANTAARFDGIMRAYAAQSNITFRLHPGKYLTQGYCPAAPSNGRWSMGLNWRIIGAGIDQTIITLTNTIGGSITNRLFYHVIGGDIDLESSYSEVSDLTVDCNLDRLTYPSIAGTTNVYKTIAAVKLNGSHTAIRRVKAIHYGVDGIDILTGSLNDDVFVLSTAATFPQYAPRASHTIIEDCIMLYPSPLTKSNIVEFIHTSGGMNVANALVAFTTNIVIRNCYIDGRFEDGTIKDRNFNSKLWHGLTVGSCEMAIVEGCHVQHLDIAGVYQDSFRTRSVICRNNTFLDVDGGGYWNFVAPGGEPVAAGLGVTSLSCPSGTTATLTTSQALHDLLPGIDIVQVAGASDATYIGSFLVTAVTDNTMTFELLTAPSDPAPTGATWRVHRGVREIQYTGNTTLLRHGTNVSYAVAAVGPFNRDDLPIFQTVLIANNFFGWSDGKPTNNPSSGPALGSVGIYVRNAKNAVIRDNLINLYTNTPGVAQQENIVARNNGNVIAYNNRGFDGLSIPAHDSFTNKFNDALAALEYRIRETNGGLEYLKITAGVMGSNLWWVMPTSNAVPGNVLTSDGGYPISKTYWGSGSSGIAINGGIGSNLTLWATAATGQTNLILRAINAQLGDLMVGMSPGGQPSFSVGTNGNVRVAKGSTNVASISRWDDYGDGISLDTDIIRFLFNTNDVAGVGNTTGFYHTNNNAALSFGATGDANLKRVAGGFVISSSNSLNADGILRLAKLDFIESQGEDVNFVQFLANNMTANMAYFWPRTNPVSGQFLTSIPVSGITNQLYWATPAGGGGGTALTVEQSGGTPSVGSVSKIIISGGTVTDNTGGIVTVATGTALGTLMLNNNGVATNATFQNSATGTIPLLIEATNGTTANLMTLRKAGATMFGVNSVGALLLGDGSAALPALARASSPTDGIFLGSGTFGLSLGGVSFGGMLASGPTAGFTHLGANPSLIFGASGDTILTRLSAGNWILNTTPTAATGEGMGSITASNVTVRGSLVLREADVSLPSDTLSLRLPSITTPITTWLWKTNGFTNQVLATTGTNLFWRDDAGGGGGAGIALVDGTGTRTTFGPGVTTGASLVLRNIASQTGPSLVLTNSAGTLPLMMITNTGKILLPDGASGAPSIGRILDSDQGLNFLPNLAQFTFDSSSSTFDITVGGVSHLSDLAFFSMGLTNDVRISRLGPGDFRLDRQGTDGRGGIQVSNINVLGTLTNNGPVTYPVKSVTLGGAGTTAPGRVDGAKGNFFAMTLGSSTNLVLTNMVEGPLTVVITNPSLFTVTWQGMRTNAWLGTVYTNQPAQALSNVTYWTFYKVGTETNGSAVSRGFPITLYETIASSATPVLEFNSNPEQVLFANANITGLTTLGKVDGIRTISLLVVETNAVTRTVAGLPAWRWQTPHWTNVVASTRGTLLLKSYNTGDSGVQAWWNPEL